jgi:hypothetical protein
MKLIKGIVVTGIVLLGCFEIIQFLNRLNALKVGKNFLHTRNIIVKSITCEVPAYAVLDSSTTFCTFNATKQQIQDLAKKLDFRPINPIILSEEEAYRLYAEFDKQAKNKGIVEPVIRTKIDDSRRSFQIEKNSCWTALGLSKRSELELYGTSENKENKFRDSFFVFYKKSSGVGCIRFESIGG